MTRRLIGGISQNCRSLLESEKSQMSSWYLKSQWHNCGYVLRFERDAMDKDMIRTCTVWVKKSHPPLKFSDLFVPNGWEFLVQILHIYYTFLSTLDYKLLFSYLQLWRSYAILSAITIMCSKCPPSTETHAGWSHLMWHNFVTVGDNLKKICILT